MLMQFNFKNFKSFRDDSSLDMTATSITEHPYNLIDWDDGEKYITVAAIYGANASDKSSVIQAFKFMRKWVNKSFKEASESEAIPFKRFAFDENCKEPAEFEVFMRFDNYEYQYGFALDNTKILEEWLYIKTENSKKYNVLFERSLQEVHCNSKLIKGAENFVPMLKEKTLFLSIIANANLKYIDSIADWFAMDFVLDYGNMSVEQALINSDITSTYIDNTEFIKKLVKFLNSIDINIDGIEYEKSINEMVEIILPILYIFSIRGILWTLVFPTVSDVILAILAIL